MDICKQLIWTGRYPNRPSRKDLLVSNSAHGQRSTFSCFVHRIALASEIVFAGGHILPKAACIRSEAGE